MYELFKVKCESEGKPIPKKNNYVKTFTTEFILLFYIPKTDTCKTCDMLDISIKSEEDLEKCIAIREQKDEHIKLAGEVRNILNDCKGKVESYLNTGEVYYLRQLQMLDLGIHAYTNE